MEKTTEPKKIKTRYLLLYSLLLFVMAYSFIGIGFALAVGDYDKLPKAILFSGAFIFWSIFAGNGIVWCFISLVCAYLFWKEKN